MDAATEKLICCCIAIALIMTVLTNAQTDRCSDEAIDACYANFTPIMTNIEDSVIMRAFSEDDIRLHCSEYEESKACIRDLSHHCHIVDRLLFHGRDSAYEWLCEDAIDVYLDQTTCWANSDLHDEGERCNATLSRDLDSIDSGGDSDRFLSRICLYANHYLDCIENSVISECNEDAGDWHREYDTRLLHPLLSATGCRLHSDGTVYYPQQTKDSNEDDDGISTITYIIVGCIIAITVILAVVLILMMLHIRQRRQKQRDQRRRRSNRNGGGGGGDPYVYYNNGADPSVAAVYPGGAQAGPLPTKGPEPPAYDPLPPPSYSADPAAVHAHAKARSEAGSAYTGPPEYASQSGSVRAPSVGSFPDDPVYRGEGAASSRSYIDIDPSDVRSERSHRSHASRSSQQRY